MMKSYIKRWVVNNKDKAALSSLLCVWVMPAVLMFLFARFTSIFDYPTLAVTLHGLIVFSIYIYTLKRLSSFLEVGKDEVYLIPIAYFFMTFILASYFSIIISNIKLIECYDFFNSFYFSVISLTTVGYGDFSPVNNLGKIVAMEIAVLAVIHTSVFIAMLFTKLSKTLRKSQD
jgi:hypothetical protein